MINTGATPVGEVGPLKDRLSPRSRVLDPVTFTAVLPIGEPTAEFLAKLLAGEHARRRTHRRRRALGCYRHAVLVLRWFLDATRVVVCPRGTRLWPPYGGVRAGLCLRRRCPRGQ